MFKFKIGDTVSITAGKDKKRTGKIIKVFPKDQKVLVEGVNEVKKHIKKTQNEAGKIVTIPKPISVGNVSVVCPSCQKTTRVGFDVSGKPKVRVCHHCRQVITDQKAK